MPLFYDKESLYVIHIKIILKDKEIIIYYITKKRKNLISYMVMISLHKHTYTYTEMYTQTPYTHKHIFSWWRWINRTSKYVQSFSLGFRLKGDFYVVFWFIWKLYTMCVSALKLEKNEHDKFLQIEIKTKSWKKCIFQESENTDETPK